MKIGIIGTGAVGESLGRYFLQKGQVVTGYFSKTRPHLLEVSKRTGIFPHESLEDLVLSSDLIIIAVNDDAIEMASNQIKACFNSLTGKIFIHTSGVHGSEVLHMLKDIGASTLSLHPLQSFADVENALNIIPKTMFSVEGDLSPEIKDWLEELEIKFFQIPGAYKVNYHMAAVIVSNYLVSVLDFGTRQFTSLGYSQEFALDALWPLIEGTVQNVRNHGTTQALTGPIDRGDISTVGKHLNILSGLDRTLYAVLGEHTVNIAKKKGLDPEKGMALLELLKEADNE